MVVDLSEGEEEASQDEGEEGGSVAEEEVCQAKRISIVAHDSDGSVGRGGFQQSYGPPDSVHGQFCTVTHGGALLTLNGQRWVLFFTHAKGKLSANR